MSSYGHLMSNLTFLAVFDRRGGLSSRSSWMTARRLTRAIRAMRAIQWLEAYSLYDWLVAMWWQTPWSARKIEPFVRKHKIDMSEFEAGPFKSRAAFFERRFPDNPDNMGGYPKGCREIGLQVRPIGGIVRAEGGVGALTRHSGEDTGRYRDLHSTWRRHWKETGLRRDRS
jgi:hypothetical protein